MLRYISLMLTISLLWAPSLWAQNFRLVSVDNSQWPLVKVTAFLPEDRVRADEYSLKLTPDGRAVTASAVHGPQDQVPVNLVVAVDTSKSLSPDQLTAAKEALERYVNLLDPEEKLALLAFNDTVQLESSFLSDREEFADQLDQLKLGGSRTELYGGLLYGINLLKDQPGRHHLLVISDGHDEGRGTSRDEVLKSARENNVRISAVGLPSRVEKNADLYLANLRDLAERSGGAYLETDSAETLRSGAYELLEQQRLLVRNERGRLYELDFNVAGQTLDGGRNAELIRSTPDEMRFVNFHLQPPTSGWTDLAYSGSAWTDDGFLKDGGPENQADGRAALLGGGAPSSSMVAPAASADSAAAAGPAGLGGGFTGPEAAPFWYSPIFWSLLLLAAGLGYYLWWRYNQQRLERETRRATSYILDFPDLGETYTLPRGTWLLGSAENNYIVIDEATISPTHAEITVGGDEWIIRDLNSRTGVLVNGLPIHDRVRLKPGDELQFGRTKAVLM